MEAEVLAFIPMICSCHLLMMKGKEARLQGFLLSSIILDRKCLHKVDLMILMILECHLVAAVVEDPEDRLDIMVILITADLLEITSSQVRMALMGQEDPEGLVDLVLDPEDL